MTKTRVLLFALIILILGSSVFSFVYFDNDFLIRKWSIPLSDGGFWDARLMAMASESYAQGYDPLIENPANPIGQRLNYPRVWHLLFGFGMNQSHTNLMGTTTVIIFFLGIAIFWFSNKFKNLTSFLLTLALLSPIVMLGVERANIELLLFFILSLALAINHYSVISSICLFTLASILKLYPVFGFVYLLKENKSKFWILFLSATGIFAVYALFSLTDIMYVFKTTPKTVGSTFGINVWWMGLGHPRFFNIPLSDNMAFTLKVISYAAASLILAAALIINMRKKHSKLLSEGQYIDSFRAGASIYIGCFLLMNTIDYRLMFLVFAIPQIVEWLRAKEKDISSIAFIALAAMGVSLWSFFIMRFLGRNITFVMEEFCNWIMLACMFYLFIASLPDWFSEYLRRPFPRGKLSSEKSISG
jgi:hypothetical protein